MRPTETGQNNLHALAAAQEVRRLWLYEIDVPDGALRLAQGRENVEYLGHTWIAAPIRHGGIDENTTGKIDSLTVEVGNLNRDMSALLELYDGLRDRKVRVLQVFDLADPDAYIDDVYYIDQPVLKGATARFTLATRYDLMEATIAPRLFGRTFCRWDYRGRGCWCGSEGNWTAPEGFVAGDSDDCDRTPTACKRHCNYKRFGGFPSVPLKKTVSVT